MSVVSPGQEGEGVDGEEGDDGSVVTSEQPRSPSHPHQAPTAVRRGGRRESGDGVSQAEALEAAELQMILIHDQYKILLREKEVHYISFSICVCMYLHMYVCVYVLYTLDMLCISIQYIHVQLFAM